MATVYFLDGSTRTDFNTSTNFNTLPDGSGSSGFPTAGDTLIFADCKQQITSGFTALSAVALAAVYVLPQASVTTSAGNSLTLDVSSGSAVFWYSGSGGLFSVTAGSGGIDELNVAANGGGTFVLASGTVALLKVASGQCRIDGVVTTYYGIGGSCEATYNATAITTAEVTGGTLRTRRTTTTLSMANSARVSYLDAAAATTVNVHGGTCNHRSRGTLATVNLRGGVLTPDGAVTNPAITTLNLYGNFGPSGTANYIKRAGAVSFSVNTTNELGIGSSDLALQSS